MNLKYISMSVVWYVHRLTIETEERTICYSKCGLQIHCGPRGLVRSSVGIELSLYYIPKDLFLKQHRCENLKSREPVTSTMQNTSSLYGSDEGE